tara:strand:- start:1451 stop:1792 length:342 start_codon:yes stop_codon:yes gene_type:complete
MPIKPKKGLVAFASVTLSEWVDNRLVPTIYLGAIGVYKFLDKEGYYVRYPKKEVTESRSFDIYHPVNKQIGDLMSGKIVDATTDIFKVISEKQKKKLMESVNENIDSNTVLQK